MSTTPKRIQRKRTKGWRMPEGAKYVGRGSTWGNPYRLDRLSAHEYVVLNIDGQELPESWGGRNFAAQYAAALYRMCLDTGVWSKQLVVDDLAGKDLACWCPLDQPCHADVLLEIANATSSNDRATVGADEFARILRETETPAQTIPQLREAAHRVAAMTAAPHPPLPRARNAWAG